MNDTRHIEDTIAPVAGEVTVERPFAVGSRLPRVGAAGLVILFTISALRWTIPQGTVFWLLMVLGFLLFVACLLVPYVLSLTSTVTFTVESDERRIAKRLRLFGFLVNVRWIAIDDVAGLRPADDDTSLYLVTREGKEECLLYRTWEEIVEEEADRLIKTLGTKIC